MPTNQPKKDVTPTEAIPFPEEVTHLIQTKTKLADELTLAQGAVDQLDDEYIRMQQYLVEHRSHIDPKEMFQGEMALKQIDRSGVFVVEMRDRLLKLQDSPYFARIDFMSKEENLPEPYYIGRFSFSHGKEIVVYDWRAPVSSLFYDYNKLGPAEYQAPKRIIEGELTKKRQFKIKDGEMEYALESAENVQDEVLQRELSQTSDERMKTIIATIQSEQNKIIRGGSRKTMIIQGAAGSGKTSIALHRVAFLLYQFKTQLTAKNVTILSPNAVFGDYISGVLPELGEEPIYELSFADIADIQLDGVIGFEDAKNLLETPNAAYEARLRFKSSLEFVQQMNAFIETLPTRAFQAEDYDFETIHIPADFIAARLQIYEGQPLFKRMELVAEDIYERMYTANLREYKLPTQRTIFIRLKRMLTFKNTLALYKEFYKEIGQPKMFMPAGKNTLEWSDVFPFLYLHHAFIGLQQSQIIRHLVVDEMQDYTPIQYAVVNALFTCPKTILGDFAQSVNPVLQHTLTDLAAMYPDAEVAVLTTSYRSTYEIIEYAKKIKPSVEVNATLRHGPEPKAQGFADESALLRELRSQIATFRASEHNNLGIITKTNQQAADLYEALLAEGEADIHLITPQSTDFIGGVTIASVQMSKGLEFDAVVIADANDHTYYTQYDRSLLYVACTRAMHSLALLYVGKKSSLLP